MNEFSLRDYSHAEDVSIYKYICKQRIGLDLLIICLSLFLICIFGCLAITCMQFDEYVLCRIINKDLDKMKYSVRNFHHHVQADAHAHQFPVVETDEKNQRNLNLGEKNSIAALLISSCSTTSTPILPAYVEEMIDAMMAELKNNDAHPKPQSVSNILRVKNENCSWLQKTMNFVHLCFHVLKRSMFCASFLCLLLSCNVSPKPLLYIAIVLSLEK
jgi:hypothetical protein